MMKAFGIDSVFRTIILIAEWINADENVQVNGVCGFVDCTEMSIKHHLHLWNLENMKKMSQYFDVIIFNFLILYFCGPKLVLC